MAAQDFLVIVGTVLAAPVGVVNAALWGPAQGNSHVQGADRQVFLHPVADGPTDHPAGMKVQDDSQIDPALPRPDIGDVTSPFLVGLARSEILLQEVWRDVECVVAPSRPIALQSPAGQRSVVALNLWVLITQIAFCRIRRPTRRCPTRNPNSFSSSVIRGRP